MAGVTDYGTGADPLNAPNLGEWAAAVSAALDDSDVTVDTRIATAVSDHDADTSVHGIADISALALTGDAPTAHAASHAAAGADPVTVAESQVTGLTAALAGKVDAATLDANSLLKADTDNTPSVLSVPASSLVGRAATGNIAALSVADVRTLVGTTRVTRPLTDDLKVEVYDATLGWVVTKYDSGWRNIASIATPGAGATLNMLQIRRVNNEVFITLSLNQDATTPTDLSFSTPAGFRYRASVADFVVLAWSSSGANTGRLYTVAGGATTAYRPIVSTNTRMGHVYNTDDAIPTSLPGTLVSAAPA